MTKTQFHYHRAVACLKEAGRQLEQGNDGVANILMQCQGVEGFHYRCERRREDREQQKNDVQYLARRYEAGSVQRALDIMDKGQ